MDIHRCRFVPFPPSTINALAFSHSQVCRGKGVTDLRLAIGRANGNIEIWNPLNGAWLQETILRGGKNRSIDGLVWIQDPNEEDTSGKIVAGKLRLFSIGYTTTVTEWDLEKGQPLRHSSGNHGEIWCLAAQPRLSPLQRSPNGISSSDLWTGQNLITGCTDGAVVLYSTADQDLKLQRILVRPSSKKAKIISVVFQDRNIAVVGCTDSTIRIYDIRTGALVRSMSLGAGPVGAPKEIITWAVKCLPNGNIISGDSTGEMRIWDGKTYTLIQRLKCHKQDILSLATSVDGSMIFSGGMDRRTVVYKQVGGVKSRWGEVTHRRFHSHDVKTMATFEGMGMSLVASGGPDGSPMILPLREFGFQYHRTLPCLPQEPVVQSAAKKRLFVSWWDREIHIWRIKKTVKPQRETAESDTEFEENNRQRKLVAKVIVKGEANITSVSITSDGDLLAVSTAAEIKIFCLEPQVSDTINALRVTKLDLPAKLSAGGARLLQFSPDGNWLGVIRRDSQIVIARVIHCGSDSFKVEPLMFKLARLDREAEKRTPRGGLGAYERTITRMAFSYDSQILAISDLAGYIDTWVLEGYKNFAKTASHDNVSNDASLPSSSYQSDRDEEDKQPIIVLGQHWIRNPLAPLPKLPSPAVILCFRPSIVAKEEASFEVGAISHSAGKTTYPHSGDIPQHERRLIVVSASGAVTEFEVMQGALSAWSRRNPRSNFPEEFKRLRDQAMGCIWDAGHSKERLWLYGSNWMWMFDLSRDLEARPSVEEELTNGHVNESITTSNKSISNKRRKTSNGDKSAADHLSRTATGAGGKVPDSELGIGISRKHQSIVQDAEGIPKERNVDHRVIISDIDVDNADERMGGIDMDSALKRLRSGEDVACTNGDVQLARGGDRSNDSSVNWWHTYKYRPIMGIVPIDGEAGLEVVLVERPTWEMDLPPRYYGDQDWEKPGL